LILVYVRAIKLEFPKIGSIVQFFAFVEHNFGPVRGPV
jgi:hypothetical protein